MELMASHDFQTALHNYLDLEDLQSRLMAWKTSLDAFDDIIRLRGQNCEPLLPEVDAPFRVEYHERLTAAHVHLNELNAPVDALTRQCDAFQSTAWTASVPPGEVPGNGNEGVHDF